MPDRNGLLTGTVVPPASRKATPRATPYMPSVPMKGGTRRREISMPLMTPGNQADQHRRREAREHRRRKGPAPGVTALMVWAATTAARPMMKPTDRSMPPEMMTKVWPSASSSGATAKIAMLLEVVGVEHEGAAVGEPRPGLEERRSAGAGTARTEVGDRAGRWCGQRRGRPRLRDVRGRGRGRAWAILRRRGRRLAARTGGRAQPRHPVAERGSVGVDELGDLGIVDVVLVDDREAGADRRSGSTGR